MFDFFHQNLNLRVCLLLELLAKMTKIPSVKEFRSACEIVYFQ